MKVRAVVFDLFETLVDVADFQPKGASREKAVSKILGINEKKFSDYWKGISSVRNTHSSRRVLEQLVKNYLQSLGKRKRKDPPKSIMNRVYYELGKYQDIAMLNPRANIMNGLATLKERKGLKLALLTNCDERECMLWRKSPIFKMFDVHCFSCQIGCEKPDREAYDSVLRRLGMTASSVAYVGDGTDNELEGARMVGFGQVILTKEFISKNGTRSRKDIRKFERIADTSVNSIYEIETLLK